MVVETARAGNYQFSSRQKNNAVVCKHRGVCRLAFLGENLLTITISGHTFHDSERHFDA